MCPMITPDFTEVLESLPAGDYQVNVVEAELKKSQAGNEYIKWQLRVCNAVDPRCNGKSIWTNTMLSGKGAFRLQNLVKAATGESIKGAFDTDTLMGKSVIVTTVDELDRTTGEKTGYADVKAFRSLS